MEMPAGWNHPDSTPIKQEEPNDWFSDKPAPIYTFGDRLIHCLTEEKEGSIFEVTGLSWWPSKKGYEWYYYLGHEDTKQGQWYSEVEIEKDWIEADV